MLTVHFALEDLLHAHVRRAARTGAYKVLGFLGIFNHGLLINYGTL